MKRPHLLWIGIPLLLVAYGLRQIRLRRPARALWNAAHRVVGDRLEEMP